MLLLLPLLLASIVCAQDFTVIAGAPEYKLDQPYGLGIGPDNALYFCEIGNHRISRLDLKTHRRTNFVGTGQKGYAGDGGPATDALVDEPYELAFNKSGDLFFCDRPQHVIRKVERKTGIVTTIAGTGKPGYAGDGAAAAQAQFNQPHSIAFAPDGHLLICDILNFRIRSLDVVSGAIETWAGTGRKGDIPEGAHRTAAPLNGPRAIAADAAGNYYAALREGNAIYRIDPLGKLYRVAGNLSGPKGIALSPDGALYIADTESHAIRRIAKDGTIATVAGDGQRGDGPRLARPHGVFVDARGAVYIADSENNRILMLRVSGP